jgi:hypothetical protein
MKKFSFLALAAAGMLLAACSSDKEVAEVGNPQEFKDGAYIGISLQLPTADETRANDDLSNGIAKEFAVKNAVLYIFKLPKGSQDNPDVKATFVDKVALGTSYEADKEGPINPDEWHVQNGVDATNVTSTYNQATLIPNELASTMKSDTQNNYYGYVIVNNNGQPAVQTDMEFGEFSKQTFTQIGAKIAQEQDISEGGLLMTNSPICDKAGGNAAPASGAQYTTLVKLDNSKIFGGKSEAEANPAGCIYIERAAVKITVVDGRSETTLDGVDVTILGWKVINVEPSYYNTRQIETAWGPYFSDQIIGEKPWKYRFVSKDQFLPTKPGTTNHTTGFRTYFAKDPQFDANATLIYTSANDARPWIAVGPQKHAYTTENTFDVGRQTWRNTTMVTLQVRFGAEGNDGFYTVGKNGQTMYTKENALNAIENIIKADAAVTAAMDALRDKISANNLNKPVTSGLKITLTSVPTEGTADVAFTVALDYQLDGNPYTTFGGTDESDLKDDLEDAITAVIDADTTTPAIETADAVLLSFYAGGIAYYNARIQHYGENETPWSATGEYISGGGKDVKEIYGYDITKGADDGNNVLATQRFLGRYGVVRDNWYKLSIDKIGKIGTAEPVDPSTTTPDTPDDEIENFLSVHVHILPWVLREQSVQF